jgi:membrane fusion protein (multidrug efflux system)
MPIARPLALASLALAAGCGVGCGKAPQAAGAPPAMPPALVEVEAAAVGPLDLTIPAIGRLGAVDSVSLTAKAAGIVTALKVEDGAVVQQGSLLIELDTAEAAAALREAQAVRDNATLELNRSQPLAASGIVDASKLDLLRSNLAIAEARVAEAQARLDDRRIFSPFAGRLGLRQVSLGALVTPGAVITTLTRMSPLKLTFSVPERELARLKTRLAVRAHTPAFPSREFSGEVAAIDPVIDPATHAVAVQALFPNPDEALKPGLSLDIELVAERIEQAVTVPERAVVLQGDQAAVFVVDQSGPQPVAKRTAVRVGVRRAGRVQIAEGLAAGTAVVVEGMSVRDGAPVSPKPSTPTSGDKTVAAEAQKN